MRVLSLAVPTQLWLAGHTNSSLRGAGNDNVNQCYGTLRPRSPGLGAL